MKTKPHPLPLPKEGGELLAMEMEGVILGLIRGGDGVDKKRWNDVRQTKPLPQPLSEERGELLAMEMEGVVWGLIVGGDVVDNKA